MCWPFFRFGFWNMGGMVIMMLFFLLFLIMIGFFIWWIFSQVGASSIAKKNPLDIAKERYAKGEITKEQYEQIKKDLA